MILDGKVKKNLDRAVKILYDSGVVAFPTETVYGLGANALDERAVKKIFQIKSRPFEDPLIVHLTELEQLEFLIDPLTPTQKEWVERLTKRFWPGPLTLVFKKRPELPDIVTGGLDTVAIRMPRHLIARALIKNLGKPVSAPSANKYQGISPTTADAVLEELGEDILILDGGPCSVGVESTVISLVQKPLLLRPGGISIEDIEDVLECKLERGDASRRGMFSSPGMMDFHYAPQKPLKLFGLDELVKQVGPRKNQKRLANTALLCFSKDEAKRFSQVGFGAIHVLSPRGNMSEAAKHLFTMLRAIDRGDAARIFAIKCPDERLGLTLNDRLKKAQHGIK